MHETFLSLRCKQFVKHFFIPACLVAFAITPGTPAHADTVSELTLEPGDHIAYIGNALADRKQHDGWLEAYLQAAHPEHKLVFRNLGFAGDRVADRPRAHDGFGDPDVHLSRVEASVIFAFFGYNESFDNDPGKFENELREWIEHTRDQEYDGEQSPRIVLFSPIAFEDLNDPNFPDGQAHNERLADYTEAMEKVAAEENVVFVDLFEHTQSLYASTDEPMTINGVHLTSRGNHEVARIIVQDLLGTVPEVDTAAFEQLREAVLDKNWHWHNRYRAASGNDVWGGRSNLHNNAEVLQHELEMIDVMAANRDERIWARAKGQDIEIDDSNVPEPIAVDSRFSRDVEYLDPERSVEMLNLIDDLEANVFASEKDFPIANPVQMQIDTRDRLWVASWATYPKWEPLKEMNDRLVILEDTTGDGRADKSTTFAKINNPTGFEFWNGGVIVASAPYLWFLKDTTGDDKADVRYPIMHAIDDADTHHTANNLILGPDGNIYYQRGIFHRHNVETPWGPPHSLGNEGTGLYGFNPRTHEFAFHVHNRPNPHGISFDRWGYQFITNGTGGDTYQVTPDHGGSRAKFDKRRLFDQSVRPVAGNMVVSSTHLPEEFQDNFLIFNTIGFQGVRRFRLEREENGHVNARLVENLIDSDESNFRPTDGAINSRGELFISDWHQPTVGHMQFNLRDPVRDHDHGRIYRIIDPDRELAEPVAIHGEPIEALLELLKHPMDGVRHRVRVELSARDSGQVIAAAQQWAGQFDAGSGEDALPLLEALWLHQQHNVVNRELLEIVLNSPNPHARHAAKRVATSAAWRTPSVLTKLEATAKASSANVGNEPAHAIDQNVSTIWHSQWQPTPEPLPHHLIIDMKKPQRLAGIEYTPRQDIVNGRIKDYALFVSADGSTWGEPVAEGSWPDGTAIQTVRLDKPQEARYLKLEARSSIDGQPFAAVAEIDVILAPKP